MSLRLAAVTLAGSAALAAFPGTAGAAPCGFHMNSTTLYVFCAGIVDESTCYTYPHCST